MHETDSKQPDLKTIAGSNRPKTGSITVRFFALLILLVLALIPISLLHNILDEKIKKEQAVVSELVTKWGNQQTIIGPILSIPYVERISRIESQTDSKGVTSSVSRDIFNNKTLMILPENLFIKADLKDKLITQNPYKTNVYQGEIELSGNFNLEALPEASGYNSIEWDRAFIAIGLSDNTSVQASSPLRWEGSSAILKPGTQLPNILKQGYHATLENVASENELPQFKLALSVKGNESLQFAPFGQLTTAKISTNWANTRIEGDIPPSSKVSSAEGFEASWRISNLVRNYPQQWLITDQQTNNENYDLSRVLTGVKLTQNSTATNLNLGKIKHSVNYALLVLAIIFLSLLILEYNHNIFTKPKFIHYLIISLPILLTPMILMTLTNFMSFFHAFQIAAATSIILIVLFITSIMKSFTQGFYILLIVASLYTAQYVMLKLPEFNLIAASAAGIWITVVLMIVSKNIVEDV